MTKYLKIDPNGDLSAVDLSGYKELRDAVGGNLEGLSAHNRPDVFMYINEDGKMLELQPNDAAEKFANSVGTPLFASDWISGVMVVCGTVPPDGGEPDGSDYDIPDDLLRLVMSEKDEEDRLWGRK